MNKSIITTILTDDTKKDMINRCQQKKKEVWSSTFAIYEYTYSTKLILLYNYQDEKVHSTY